MLHSIHQERQYNENYWNAWPLQGQCSLGTTDDKMHTKKQEKLTPLIFDDLRLRVRPENLTDIYTRIKHENEAKTLHVGIIFMGVLISQVCIYKIYIYVTLQDETTNFMTMSQDHHAEKNHNRKICNKFFKRVQHFRYFGTT